jgi:hypothetical protein
LHANTEIPAHRRDQLERLVRYTGRGAVSLERLKEDVNGDLVYSFNLNVARKLWGSFVLIKKQ